jgi:hypothetical protein
MSGEKALLKCPLLSVGKNVPVDCLREKCGWWRNYRTRSGDDNGDCKIMWLQETV